MLWISNLLGGCKYKIFCIYIQSVNSKWTTWHSITMWILKSNSRSAPTFIRNVDTWSTSYVGLKKTLNLNHILCLVRLNLAQFSSGNQFIIPVMHFFTIFFNSTLENNRALGPLFEQSWIPYSQARFRQAWLKWTTLCLGEIFFLKPIKVSSLFSLLLPLEILVNLYLNELGSTIPKRPLCQVWLKFGLWICRKESKYEKFKMTTAKTLRTTDNRAFGSWEPKL